MTYYVEAIRYQRDDETGLLLTADKRVHTGLSHAEADKLFKRYVRDENGYRNDYWHDVRMTLEDDYDADHYDRLFAEHMDGVGENQII